MCVFWGHRNTETLLNTWVCEWSDWMQLCSLDSCGETQYERMSSKQCHGDQEERLHQEIPHMAECERHDAPAHLCQRRPSRKSLKSSSNCRWTDVCVTNESIPQLPEDGGSGFTSGGWALWYPLSVISLLSVTLIGCDNKGTFPPWQWDSSEGWRPVFVWTDPSVSVAAVWVSSGLLKQIVSQYHHPQLCLRMTLSLIYGFTKQLIQMFSVSMLSPAQTTSVQPHSSSGSEWSVIASVRGCYSSAPLWSCSCTKAELMAAWQLLKANANFCALHNVTLMAFSKEGWMRHIRSCKIFPKLRFKPAIIRSY